MKKIVTVGFLVGMLGGSLLASESKWDCYRYVGGEPTGGSIKVYANDKSKAEDKAYKKYKDLGYSLDSVECKRSW